MQALAGLLGIAAFFVTWILVARKGRGRNWSGVQRHVLGALLGLVSMFVVAGIFAPPQASLPVGSNASNVAARADAAPDTKPTPEDQAESDKAERLKKVRKLSHGITEVSEPTSGRLSVTQGVESVWSEKAWANSATLWTPEFLEKLTEAYPGHYKEVVIRFVVPVKDKYGNSSTGEAMTLTYDMAEIAKVNWKGVMPFDIMNFAEVYFRPIGRQGVLEWCADGNAEYAQGFCERSLQ